MVPAVLKLATRLANQDLKSVRRHSFIHRSFISYALVVPVCEHAIITDQLSVST